MPSCKAKTRSTNIPCKIFKNLVDRIESDLNARKKEMFPAQPNPRTQCKVNEVKNPQLEHARSGKFVNKEIPTKVSEPKGNSETKKDDKPSDVEARVFMHVAPFPKGCLHLKMDNKSRYFGSV